MISCFNDKLLPFLRNKNNFSKCIRWWTIKMIQTSKTCQYFKRLASTQEPHTLTQVFSHKGSIFSLTANWAPLTNRQINPCSMLGISRKLWICSDFCDKLLLYKYLMELNKGVHRHAWILLQSRYLLKLWIISSVGNINHPKLPQTIKHSFLYMYLYHGHCGPITGRKKVKRVKRATEPFQDLSRVP